MPVDPGPAAVRGFRFAGVSVGLKQAAGAKDLGLIVSDTPAAAAAVFSANKVKAAPIYVTMDRLRSGKLQAVVANSGCANSFTGRAGIRLAEQSCARAAKVLGIDAKLVVPSSTGVIGHLYDPEKFHAGVIEAASALREDAIEDFARAIMTTDTRPKMASASARIGGGKVMVAGVAKGSGMISPRMATMLAYLITDARVPASALRAALRSAMPESFNAITVDGDMSTNDTVLILANGASECASASRRELEHFNRMVREVCTFLARELVYDGEGATRLVSIEVRGAKSASDAERCARQIANSPLVKTAFFGCDPNVGRILMAAGSSGAAVDSDRLVLSIAGVKVAARGALIPESLPAAAEKMHRREFAVTLDLRLGQSRARILTCDLSYDYVKINAEYTT